MSLFGRLSKLTLQPIWTEVKIKILWRKNEEGEHIFVQLTGQPRFEIFPRSETEFLLKVVKADITFEQDGSGKVTV